jgi:precorrin-3B synthase
MDVCPGAPACPNATTATRDDAQRLVEAITRMDAAVAGFSLHVSGCEKGCARHGTADITLVAHDGHYDIIRDGDPGGPITAAGVAPSEIAVAVGRLLRQRLQ